MRRERLEDLGSIRVLINDALKNNIFQKCNEKFGDYFEMHGLEIQINEEASRHVMDIAHLQKILNQINELSKGYEET